MWRETPLKVCGNFKMTISFLAYSKAVPEDCSIVFFRCISGHFSMQFWWQKWVPSPSSHSFRSLQWTLSPRPACSDNHHYWNWKKIVKKYIFFTFYICIIYQAWGQDGWILTKFFFAILWTKTQSRSIKTLKKPRPMYSHLDRRRLVNKGFIIWPKRELSLEEPTREIPSPSRPLG